MNDTKKRCHQCMKEIDFAAAVCPHCGFSAKPVPADPNYLPPGTTLAHRYQLGNLLQKNAEHAIYIAYDNHLDVVVTIKEFFPPALVLRNSNGSITAIPGKKSLLLEQMEAFLALNQTLSKFRTIPSLIQVYSVFEENHTLYAVSETVQGVTLREYLFDHYGELSWSEASPLFIELIKTLSHLHKIGIIQGALSPETIYITELQKPKITGFLTPFFRQKNEISQQILYDGYAAPEQYDENQTCGPWTDVYSVAAVLYKALTGTMPTPSNTRAFNDNLIAPDILNSNVPKNVSLAIMAALTLSAKLRTQTMDDFFADVITPLRASQKTADFHYDKYFDPPEETEEESEEDDRAKTKQYMITALSITLSVLLISSLILIFLVFGNDIFGG